MFPERSGEADLLLGHNGGVVVQRVAQHVATHALARLVVKVLKERREVFELEDRQNVVVGVHRDLQQPGQLFGHRAAGCYAKEGEEDRRVQSIPLRGHFKLGAHARIHFLG